MKYIIAVIQPHRLEAVREALADIGVQGLTVSEVRGFGRQKGQTEVYRGAEYTMQYVPKVKLEIAVSASLADSVVEALGNAARTGHIGDGKVFVLPLEGAMRVRTGEMGADASTRRGSASRLARGLGGEVQILDQEIELAPLVARLLQAEQIRRVHGDEGIAPVRQGDEAAAIGVDGKRLAQQRAGRGRPERHSHGGLDQRELVVEPPAAGVDLAGVGFLVQASLAARLVLEVLHRVGDVDRLALDSRRLQRSVEHLAGRSDEGASGQVFLIARLLADQHQRRIGGAFAEHGLGRILVEMAARAISRFRRQGLQRPRRDR